MKCAFKNDGISVSVAGTQYDAFVLWQRHAPAPQAVRFTVTSGKGGAPDNCRTGVNIRLCRNSGFEFAVVSPGAVPAGGTARLYCRERHG